MVRLGGYFFSYQHLRFRVSIPVWCDWELVLSLPPEVVKSGFNSSMVRLGELTIFFHNTGVLGFNSSMVRLGDGESLPFLASDSSVSIPVWCDWEQPGPGRLAFS